MAEIVTCGNCGKRVQKNASKCPHCGVEFHGIRNKNSFENRPRTYVRCKVCGQTSIWYSSNPKDGQCNHCLSFIDVNGNPIENPYDKITERIGFISFWLFIIAIIYGLVSYFVFHNFSLIIFGIALVISIALFLFYAWAEAII